MTTLARLVPKYTMDCVWLKLLDIKGFTHGMCKNDDNTGTYFHALG